MSEELDNLEKEFNDLNADILKFNEGLDELFKQLNTPESETTTVQDTKTENTDEETQTQEK